jgi:hypothetical protein
MLFRAVLSLQFLGKSNVRFVFTPNYVEGSLSFIYIVLYLYYLRIQMYLCSTRFQYLIIFVSFISDATGTTV